MTKRHPYFTCIATLTLLEAKVMRFLFFFFCSGEKSLFSMPSSPEMAQQFCCTPITHHHLQHAMNSQQRSLSPVLQDQVPYLEKQLSLWPVRKANTGTAENNCEEPGAVKFSCSYSSPPKDCGNSFQETPVKGHEEDLQWKEALLPPILIKTLVPLRDQQGCCKSPGEGAGLAL